MHAKRRLNTDNSERHLQFEIDVKEYRIIHDYRLNRYVILNFTKISSARTINRRIVAICSISIAVCL